MKTEELRKIWKAEEALAHIHGWDFSHIDSRYREEGSLPWDDMSMDPYDWKFCTLLKELVEEGEVPMSRIDDAVRRE